MKGMMIVIDKMENTCDRDSESYSNHLEHLLDLESNAIEGYYLTYYNLVASLNLTQPNLT